MKKYVYYGIFILAFIISLLYDKGIVSSFTNNRIGLIDGFITWISSVFTGFVIFLVITTLFLWQEHKRKWILPVWASFLASGALSFIIKYITNRPRPFEALGLPLVKGADYIFAFWNSSFPSFHTAAVFSVLAILDKEFKHIRWFWIAFACLIAFSRLYLGVHYLSDILAGGIIGYLTGKLFLFVEEKHKLFKPVVEFSKKLWH